jgi:hypothetical protein
MLARQGDVTRFTVAHRSDGLRTLSRLAPVDESHQDRPTLFDDIVIHSRRLISTISDHPFGVFFWNLEIPLTTSALHSACLLERTTLVSHVQTK